MRQPRLWMRPDEPPLGVRCRIKKPRFLLVVKVSRVNKGLCISKARSVASRQKPVCGNVAQQENNCCNREEPAAHRSNQRKLSPSECFREQARPPAAAGKLVTSFRSGLLLS